MLTRSQRNVFYSLWMLLLLLTGGCGGTGQDGPRRYHLTGIVSFNGKPVPAGMVYFNPDVSRGNAGPGSGSQIKDGRFLTPQGGGVVGGPTVVQIIGFDGSGDINDEKMLNPGKELFPPYEVSIDLEQKNGERNFEVPKPSKRLN